MSKKWKNEWKTLAKDINKNEIDELDEYIIERAKKKEKEIYDEELNEKFLKVLDEQETSNEKLLDIIEQSRDGKIDLWLRLPIKQFYEHCKRNNIKEFELATHIYSEYLAKKRKKEKSRVFLPILIEELKGFCKEYEIKEIEFNFNDFDINSDVKENQTEEKENKMSKQCCKKESKLENALKGSKHVWLTTPQAAKFLGINERTIRRMIERGDVESTDCGGAQAKYLVRVSVS